MKDALSILISTMNRTSLDFLYLMFPDHQPDDLNILIINQTRREPLETNEENIKVINTDEFGLSKSRNLALDQCQTRYALLADDDVVYGKDLIGRIENAYQAFPDAALIGFKLQRPDGSDHKQYPLSDQALKITGNKYMLSSAEISLDMERIRKHQLKFCTYFGLGSSIFNSCEETLFLRSLLKRKEKAFFVNETIGTHKDASTGHDPLDKDFIQALTACQFFTFGFGSFFWLIYYLMKVRSAHRTDSKQLKTAFKRGANGIYKANRLKKEIVDQL